MGESDGGNEPLLGEAAAPAADAGDSAPLLGGASGPGSVQLPEWMGEIGDDIKIGDGETAESINKSATLSKYTTQAEANKAHIQLAKAFGNTVPRLTKDSTAEQITSFHKATGVPDNSDGYTIELGDAVEGVNLQTDQVDGFKKFAHSIHLNQDQTQALVNFQKENMVNQVKATITGQKDSMEALSTGDTDNEGWGSETEKKLVIANTGLKALGNGKFAKRLNDTGLGSDPDLIRGLYDIGLLMQEQGLIGQSENQFVGGELAKTKIAEMEGNKDHPLYNKSHAAHKAAVDERDRLYRIAESEEKKAAAAL